MTERRLTREECQAIAERTMESLVGVDAAEALRRFRAGKTHTDEVSTDDVTGKPFRRVIAALPVGDEAVLLGVTISAEPRIVRRARRLKRIADVIEGWRGGPAGVAARMLPVDDRSA